MVVVDDELDLAAVDAAGGVDGVGGHLRALADAGAGDGAFLGDDADADRLLGLGAGGACGEQGGGGEQGDAQWRAVRLDMRPPRLASA